MVSNDLLLNVHVTLVEIFGCISIWRQFKIVELNEVVRQQGDNQLMKMLNNIRIGTLDDDDTATLKSKFVDASIINLQSHTLHIFAENAPADRHNLAKLEALGSPLLNIPSIVSPKNVSPQKIEKNLNRSQSNTDGLAQLLHIKVNATSILTVSINVKDRLVNEQLGTVMHIAKNHRNEVFKRYVQCDDNRASLTKINIDIFGKQHCWVPIGKAE